MSYDIYLVDEEDKTCIVKRHKEGGTFVANGTNDAHLNVTYNYSDDLHLALDEEEGIRWLYGKSGKECTARLEAAVKALGTKRDDNYWERTPGNAGYALSILLKWAKEHPTARFTGD
jgi:hypothetical protein